MIALYIILGFVILVIVPHLLASYLIFLRFYRREEPGKIEERFFHNDDYKDYYEMIKSAQKELVKRNHKKVHINSFDGFTLYADYYPNYEKKIVMLVHGFKSNPMINFPVIADIFYKKGYSLLIVDQRAHGRSQGKYITYGYKEKDDVISWVHYIDKNMNEKEIVLYGISMGAASIALASPRLAVKSIVLDSCFTSRTDLIKHLAPKNVFFKYLVLPFVNYYARLFARMPHKDFNVGDALERNKNKVIFLHGDIDRIAPLSFMEELYKKTKSKKYRIVVAGAPHSMPILEGKDEVVKELFLHI